MVGALESDDGRRGPARGYSRSEVVGHLGRQLRGVLPRRRPGRIREAQVRRGLDGYVDRSEVQVRVSGIEHLVSYDAGELAIADGELAAPRET